MNYKLSLSYNGSKYHGWAIQPDVVTIHGTLNKVLFKLFNITPNINASGRTDAYVHAINQVINLKHDQLNISASDLKNAINSQLPMDIRVNDCIEISDTFHARFHCKNKTYNYLIETRNKFSVMEYEQVYQYNKPIDEKKLKEIMPLFIGTKNFHSFSTSTLDDCIRTVNSINLTWHDSILSISINGDGFLRNMVRMIVGIFLAYNDNLITINDINELFRLPIKGSAKYKAYACGLYLVKVNY